MYRSLLVIAILFSGLAVGSELSVAAFLHPTIARFPDQLHASARRAFAELFGRVMPFWYAAAFILSAVVAWLGPPFISPGGKLLLVSALLWLVAIVYSLILPAPLNSRIAQWQLQSLPSTWKSDAQRWDRLHAFRMVILIAALICLIIGAVMAA